MADEQRYNERPINIRKGKAFIDGVEIMDSIKCEIRFTPDVWSGKLLGETTDSRRWIGATITGNITRRRSTPFCKEKVMTYIRSGKTPEMTIQGIINDENSDYYEKYGTDVVTCVGCVITGDIPLTSLDSKGQVIEDNVAFGAKNIV